MGWFEYALFAFKNQYIVPHKMASPPVPFFPTVEEKKQTSMVGIELIIFI
jgi:hypothetical protein